MDNPYHKDSDLLAVIVKSGDPLIANMDERGQWVFDKKDGSTWGKIWMPWTYSRWIRTYQLIRDDMPTERREAWKQALTLGFTGISQKCLGHVHNIPAHHAMGLYAAGQSLDRPEWCEQAAAFMETVIGRQSTGGYPQLPVCNGPRFRTIRTGKTAAQNQQKAVSQSASPSIGITSSTTLRWSCCTNKQGMRYARMETPFRGSNSSTCAYCRGTAAFRIPSTFSSMYVSSAGA